MKKQRKLFSETLFEIVAEVVLARLSSFGKVLNCPATGKCF